VEEVIGKYSLILICWPEGNASAIHDHPNADCVMKCVKNQVRETRFEWPQSRRQKMVVTGVTDASEGEVFHIHGKPFILKKLHFEKSIERCRFFVSKQP
jgi:cysteine dioxygenase